MRTDLPGFARQEYSDAIEKIKLIDSAYEFNESEKIIFRKIRDQVMTGKFEPIQATVGVIKKIKITIEEIK